MGPFEMVVAIVAIVAVAKLLRQYMHNQALQKKQLVDDDLMNMIERLDLRMQTIESLVGNQPASREFDRD